LIINRSDRDFQILTLIKFISDSVVAESTVYRDISVIKYEICRIDQILIYINERAALSRTSTLLINDLCHNFPM